jgi:hypothetical protein
MNLLKTITVTTPDGFNYREVLVPNNSKVVSVSGMIGFNGGVIAEPFLTCYLIVEQSPPKGGIGENIMLLMNTVSSNNTQPIVFSDMLIDIEGANNISIYLAENDGFVPLSGTIVLSFYS